MLRKKIGAIILALSMITSLVVVPQSTAMAAGKAKISLVYLGTGTNATTTAQALPTEPLGVDTQFWVGLQFSNMSALRDLLKSNTTGDSGLNNFSWGMLYDTEYLAPVTTSAGNLLKAVQNNYPYDADNDEAIYRMTSVNRAGGNGVAADAEPNELNADTTKSYSYLVEIDPDKTLASEDMGLVPKIFQDNQKPFADSQVGDAPVIMAVARYKVVKSTPGKKVLQLGLGQNIFTMGIGNTGAGDGQALAWNQSATTDASTNLKNYFDVVDKDGNAVTSNTLDIFPGGTTQTGIKVTSDTTALTYKDMQDVHGITKVVKALENGNDGAEITDYQYYYGPTNSKVEESVAKSLTGLTEIKTAETDTWQNGVPKAANGQCLYIVAGDYMWNVGVLSVSDASITGLSNGSLTDGFTSRVVGVDNISFTGGQVTATYDNGGKTKAIQFADFGTNNLAVYRKDGTTYTEIPATGSTVKFAAANAIYIATKDATGKKEVKVKDIAGTAVTTSYSIATQPKTAYAYPETLDISNLVIKVTSTDPSLAGNKTLAEAQAAGIFDSVKIGTETVTAGTTKITKAHANKTIDFYKGNTKVAGLSSSKITFTPKEVTLTASATGLTKVYDGNDSVSGTITYGVTGLEIGDSAGTISGLTAKYASTDVNTGIAINISGTPASNNTDFNNKYTFASAKPTNVTGDITKKALNNLTFTISASQNPTQEGDYAVPSTDLTVTTAMGKVGSDDVKIVMTNGKISETDMKNGNSSAAVTGASFALDGAKKDNYSIGAVTVTANVTNLPSATDLDTATKALIKDITMLASDAKNTEANLITGLAGLPTEGQSTVAGNDGKVNIAWTVTPAFDIKGATYTYTGKVTPKDPTKLVTTIADLTVTVTVTPVEITAPTVDVPATAQVGDTVTLPTTGTTKAGDTTVNYTITWNPASVDTSAEADVTVTGTITYTDAPAWVTIPDAAKTVTKTVKVSDKPLTVVKSVKDAPADITINAGNEKNQPDNKLAELLPSKLTVIDADNNEVEVDVEWTTTDAYDIKGGEYTYTATFKTEGYDYSAVSGENAPTVKVKVDAVTLGYDSKIFDAKTVNTGSKISLTTSGTATVTPSVEGLNVPYTVTWTPDPTAADTSAAATLKFTGTVAFDQTVLDANPWLTVPTELSKDVTVTVKKKSTGGGGGGTSAYTVKFSAGKYGKITEGKTSVSIIKGKKVETTSLPTVTPNEGYKFLGWSTDGKTVIDPTADAVSKGVTYTALYEEIVEPTPTPSQTPIIDKNYTKPYASGYDDGMFLPNDYITRAELASMIARLSYGDDIPDSYRTSFPDVDNTWYNKYIGYLEDKNVLSGYEDGTFRPNQTVTRGEMCAVIARAQKYDLISVDDMFSDVTDADWAKAYITTLATKNIVSGYEDGTFGTYSLITRAETVAIINRILEPSTAVITFTPLDIAGHWAEADILLAVNEREIKGTVTEPTATPEATPEATAEPEVTPEATTEPTETPAA